MDHPPVREPPASRHGGVIYDSLTESVKCPVFVFKVLGKVEGYGNRSRWKVTEGVCVCWGWGGGGHI